MRFRHPLPRRQIALQDHISQALQYIRFVFHGSSIGSQADVGGSTTLAVAAQLDTANRLKEPIKQLNSLRLGGFGIQNRVKLHSKI
ncbi:MAG: hypothetical protein J0I16_22965 [Rhizobiales bacterium]|nr:hypothetical protein [Hyphomicrobiales bacterium]